MLVASSAQSPGHPLGGTSRGLMGLGFRQDSGKGTVSSKAKAGRLTGANLVAIRLEILTFSRNFV